MPNSGKILISACLLGQKVRFDGGACALDSPIIEQLLEQGLLVPVCPECLGGLPVPRPECQIRGGDGNDVLAAQAAVVSIDGTDMGVPFRAGAHAVLALAKDQQIRAAVLKQGSPSCATRLIHDGRFVGNKIAGEGVTSALLRGNGVKLFDENETAALEEHLAAVKP